MECYAEMLGVFIYVFLGVGSQVIWVVGNIIKFPGLSTIFQVGLAYAFGILFAMAICAGTSGGHFNPCITITLVVFKGFPKLKAVRYIIAQILGAYIACFLIYVQQKVLIGDAMALLAQAGTLNAEKFTPSAPPGAFALYLLPGQSLGRAFLNEFVVDVFLGLVIWATQDPTNFLVPPPFAPVVMALAYASAIWGFSTAGLAANSARDLGGRFMAMTIWGAKASGGRYAAIAALTNIPATLLAAAIYEFILSDSKRVVPGAWLEYEISKKYMRETNGKDGGSSDLDSEMAHIRPLPQTGDEHHI